MEEVAMPANFRRWVVGCRGLDGFIVVYPNAINGGMMAGSERLVEHDRTIDDVSFLIAVVEEAIHQHNVDRTRVFATGMQMAASCVSDWRWSVRMSLAVSVSL